MTAVATTREKIDPLPARSSFTAPEANFRSMMDMAESLLNSGFLPKSVNTPAKAIAIIMTGREMGIGPMQALRSIMIVEGKPVLAADLQLALFHKAGGKSEFRQLDDKGAVLIFHAPWLGRPHTESFLEADARSAALLNKDNWKKYPKAMYRSRVITAGLKSIGFEPTTGAYDPDELDVVIDSFPARPDTLPDDRRDVPDLPEPPAGVTRDGEIVQPPARDITQLPTAGTAIDFGPPDWRGKKIGQLGDAALNYLLSPKWPGAGSHSEAWRALARHVRTERDARRAKGVTMATAPATTEEYPAGVLEQDADDGGVGHILPEDGDPYPQVLVEMQGRSAQQNRTIIRKAQQAYRIPGDVLATIMQIDGGKESLPLLETPEEFTKVLCAIGRYAEDRARERDEAGRK